MNIVWSDNEIEYLRQNAGTLYREDLCAGLKPISARIGVVRSANGVYKKMLTMGLNYTLRGKHYWKSHEIRYLKKYYGKKPTSELAKRFKVTPKSIIMVAHSYGISSTGRPTTSKKGRPCKLKMVQETPWKERLMDVYAVAVWFDEHEFEIDMRNDGILIAVFRRETPDYTDAPMALYDRFLKEDKLPGKINIDVFAEERPPNLKGFRGFNAMKVGQPTNYEY